MSYARVHGLSVALVNGEVKVGRVCAFCDQLNTITLPGPAIHGIRRWQRGEASIQIALPTLTPSEREVILSGSHDACWDRAYGETEGES